MQLQRQLRRESSKPMVVNVRQYCQGACHLSMSFSSHALNLLCAVAISVWIIIIIIIITPVPLLGQQPMLQNAGNTLQMMLSARSWAGPASP